MDMVWSDDFNGNYNASAWSIRTEETDDYQVFLTTQVATGPTGVQLTTAQVNNVYQSAKMDTRDKVSLQYGTVEYRAFIPDGLEPGAMPSVSLMELEDESYLIRMMEMGRLTDASDIIRQRIHSSASYIENGQVLTGENYVDFRNNVDGQYHTFRYDWTPTEIRSSVDGTVIYEENVACVTQFQKPAYLILEMSAAGDSSNPVTLTSSKTFEIDYVKIYNNGHTMLNPVKAVPEVVQPPVTPPVMPPVMLPPVMPPVMLPPVMPPVMLPPPTAPAPVATALPPPVVPPVSTVVSPPVSVAQPAPVYQVSTNTGTSSGKGKGGKGSSKGKSGKGSSSTRSSGLEVQASGSAAANGSRRGKRTTVAASLVTAYGLVQLL
jgi:hypothetical protein